MMEDEDRLSKIAICGRPHELWPVVAILANNLPDYIGLIIVEDAESETQPAALSLACSDSFFGATGIDIRELLLACDGIFGLGCELGGLPGDQDNFFVSPSGNLPRIEGARLNDIMLHAALLHSDPDQLDYLLQPFRFAARAAKAGKFDFPGGTGLSPTRLLGPTLQIDRGKYARFLKQHFSPRQEKLIVGRPVAIEESFEKGKLQAVSINNGEKVAADLFIDVSGVLSELARGNAQRQSGLLPFDRYAGCFDESAHAPDHLHRRIHVIAGGIVIETPLRSCTASELLYSSADMDEAALAMLARDNAAPDVFDAFYSDNPWTGNLLRLGNASACLGPYQSADMRLLHEHSKLLATLIPARKNMEIESAEFNHHQMRALEEIRDFALLQFVCNRRDDRLWKDLADAPAPASLQLRIDQFRSRGKFVEYDHEIFDQQSWIELMIGLGIIPRRVDPKIRALDMRRIQPALKEMAGEFNRTIAAMQDHADFMEGYFAERA